MRKEFELIYNNDNKMYKVELSNADRERLDLLLSDIFKDKLSKSKLINIENIVSSKKPELMEIFLKDGNTKIVEAHYIEQTDDCGCEIMVDNDFNLGKDEINYVILNDHILDVYQVDIARDCIWISLCVR